MASHFFIMLLRVKPEQEVMTLYLLSYQINEIIGYYNGPRNLDTERG